MQAVLLFIVGLILLVKGGDWFVEGASGIAHKLHIPELLIGATVVSIGTTLPEVMVSATSAVTGHGEIAYGNAIGSIICNTALISAITIAIKPSKVEKKSLYVPLAFFFGAAIYYVFNAYAFGSFSRLSGIVLLLVFCVYIGICIKQALTVKNQAIEDMAAEEEGTAAKDIFFLIVGAVLIAVGAKLLVDNGTLIAQALGVPESVIALTFVALGTSLPELVTAITSLAKGHGALSLGNVIGANLFNLVLVSGTAISLSPFDIPKSNTIAGMNSSLVLDVPVMLFVMGFMAIPALIWGKLYRSQGIILLLIYFTFCGATFFL